MSKEKIKKLIVCLVALMSLVLIVTTSARATDSIDDAGNIEDILSGNDETETIVDETGNNNTNTNSNSNLNTNENANANSNLNFNSNSNVSSYPNTGVDYSVVVIIAVCGISAVYAYKKIRDYKSL